MKRTHIGYLCLGLLLLGGLGYLTKWLITAPQAKAVDVQYPEEPLRNPEAIPPPPLAFVDGFDFPVGPPNAKGYYNAQGFQKNDHLGEDWNGVGGGNTDKGDPVYAVAHGRVSTAEDAGPGWGNVVRIVHYFDQQGKRQPVESIYAHLDKMLVHADETVQRGQQIGTIGDANGAYWAHLHLEMRWKVGMELGGGYGTDTTGFLVPTKYIQNN